LTLSRRNRRAPTSLALARPALCGAAVALLGACSEPNLDGVRFACSFDADCGESERCALVDERSVCVATPQGPLRLGMSGPLQGASRDLGGEMRRGISAMFSRVNLDSGGVFGRPLELSSVNDNYDPGLALEVTKDLLDIRTESDNPDEPDVRGPNGVFALLGSVGTPTMLATAPLATKNRVLFFGPFTGSQAYLRDGTNSPYVYNYRAGYYDEAEAIVDYPAQARIPRVIVDPATDYRRILVFAQQDSYGDAGYSGLVEAYNRRVGPLPDANAIARVGYERESVASVDPAIARAREFLSNLPGEPGAPRSAALVMVDTYQPGNKLTREIKDWIVADAERAASLDVLFIHVSFVGSDSLAQALSSPPEPRVPATNPTLTDPPGYAEGVMVTQVVPSYESQAPGIAEYRADIDRFDGAGYSFTSLEGYIVARLFVEALRLNGPDLSTDRFLETLDTRVTGLDIGIGTLLSFSPTDHQASDTVWLSEMRGDGSFRVPYVWNPVDGITSN
jgi:ABC-type branched-subunit amino acid transport system substrate-binding protein